MPRRRRLGPLHFLLLPLLLNDIATAGAQEIRFAPEVHSYSGSPLLLEVTIDEPGLLTGPLTIRSDDATITYDAGPAEQRDELTIQVAPFLGPGVHELVISADSLGFAEYRIAFVDWVWGRDNLRFGNNASYESVIGSYGEILEEWIDSRFGALSRPALVTLVDLMYQFFGARSGRCYAFAGSELRYWLWPEQLPGSYDAAYDIRLGSSRNQRILNYLQLDMAYAHFFGGERRYLPAPALEHESALQTLAVAQEKLESGRPLVLGLMGPNLHHAMLAYGFIRNEALGYTDVLVANNWKSDQDTNTYSRDAEFVRVLHARPEGEDAPALVQWHSQDGDREKEITGFFHVPIQEEFLLDEAIIHEIARARIADLRSRDRALVVVEDASRASVTDGEAVTGYAPGLKEEVAGVVIDRINRTYRFEVPAGQPLTLDFADRNGTRVLYFHPGMEAGAEHGWVSETPDPGDGQIVRRRIELGAPPPDW